MTGEYAFVVLEHQNELTRRIQEKLADAAAKVVKAAAIGSHCTITSNTTIGASATTRHAGGPAGLADAAPVTTLLQ